jgi:hypothetical protein
MIKGQQGITDMLNLPALDEVLRAQTPPPLDPEPSPPEPDQQEITRTVEKFNEINARMALIEGTDHADKMDELYKEILGHARDLMQYGYNIDNPRARGIFEIAAAMYGHAMSAANHKRDAQLKTLKMALDKRKMELDERRAAGVTGQQAATIDNDNTIVVEDRNELIRRLRENLPSK